jgi:hypothetical protein
MIRIMLMRHSISSKSRRSRSSGLLQFTILNACFPMTRAIQLGKISRVLSLVTTPARHQLRLHLQLLSRSSNSMPAAAFRVQKMSWESLVVMATVVAVKVPALVIAVLYSSNSSSYNNN